MKKLFFAFIASIVCCGVYAQPLPITGPDSVCVGSTITLGDATSGGSWSSAHTGIATVDGSGIVTGVASGIDSIVYTTGGGSAYLAITVNAIPSFISSLTPPFVCDSQIFNYTPLASVAGTSFTWSCAPVTGIIVPASSGSDNPNEQLINTTYYQLALTYAYTLTVHGCSNHQNVTVSVNPTPKLSSALTLPPICTGNTVSYTPSSYTPGAVFAWDRPYVPGVGPAANFAPNGTGVIHETLTDSTTSPVTVNYIYRLGIDGCSNIGTQIVSVTIDTCHTNFINTVAADDIIRISPNPAHGSFEIEIPGTPADAMVSITDMAGRVVKRQQSTTGRVQQIDLQASAGIYIVTVSIGSGIYRRKLVIQ